ncbi:liver stage antigen 1 [Plasmodium reichenowi]|uniref:Liver stage antigen 1 n=1 Tax=Plasmodium reichenowi TaxID=5854 RepID=A0A060RYW2_PLARE|nr:liver stage antigen 1 [Plasmodium reichenowi]
MKHILYISFYFILVNLLIFQINGKILKKSENDEIIKSNLRSGSSNSLNQIYEEKHEKKHALSHNSYDKTKNNENHKFFDKDKEVSISNLKNVSQTNVKNALRNFGVSENIFLQENKLGEEGKLINHITNDDENKEKYIKGEEENREEDPEEKAARERQEAEEKAARERQEAEEKAAREKQEAEEKAARERQVAEKAAREKQEAEEKAAREKQEAEEKAAREREESPKRALAEQRAAFERIDSMKQKLEGGKEHGDVLAEDLYGRLEIPVIELPSENEGGYYIQHQSSLPQDNRGNSRDSKEISIIEKTNRESITTNVEGRRDIHKGHLEEKKDVSIKPEQKEDKSADVQNHALETVNILDVKDFQISEYEDEISAEYDDSLIDEEEDDEDLDQFKPIVQYDNFQDEENIGIYKELEDLIEKNENLDDLDEGIEKSSEELSEEKKKKGKKYEKTKDTNFKPNDKSLYDEHIKKYKNVKQINKEKEKFIKSLFHIFDGDNEILQIVDELSEDITKYFMKL